MRDPSRIPHVLHQLKAIWLKNPDMRLGQLLGNVLSQINPDMEQVGRNLLVIEDEYLEDYLDRWDSRDS